MPVTEQVTPRVLTVKQAAQYINMSVWFVRELVYKRAIPYHLVGQKYLFDPGDLDAYLESKKVEAR